MYHICFFFVFFYIYLLNGYWELNSFEEPCFTLVANITSFARELNPTGVGGAYILSSADRLSFYQNSSVWLDRLDSRSWNRNLADWNAIYIYIYIYIYIHTHTHKHSCEYIGSSCLCSSMWRGPQEYITYEFVLTSSAVSHIWCI